jgi:hypothetical protein
MMMLWGGDCGRQRSGYRLSDVLPPGVPLGAFARTKSPVTVRRAELVPITVKRAGFWRLPSQEFGIYKWYHVPEDFGGGRVWARFMGTAANFSDIPSRAELGDVWNVSAGGGSTWILCQPVGYSRAVWIDP